MSKQVRQKHQKSRTGCLNCKRRRVKCDENKPTCRACLNFGIPCPFSTHDANTCASCEASQSQNTHNPQARPRGRGRPRKDWTWPPEDARRTRTCKPRGAQSAPNLDHAELLLHFTQCTARSLAGDDDPQDKMAQLWTHNVPRIGLSNPFVLDLMYALAAHHLALSSSHSTKTQHYKSLAEAHVAAGTAGLARVMASLSDSNCGAGYIGATLLCYCSFAAGPSGSGDLFLCHVDGGNRWQNLVSGVRLIRESFHSDVLFAGLMSPLGPSKVPETKDDKPSPLCTRLGFKSICWQRPLLELKRSVSARDGSFAEACVDALDELACIYEGVYGDEAGECNVSEDRQFVLGWLYRLDSVFVEAVQGKDTDALIILAYFAVLLATMEREWWLRGWAQHIVGSVGDIVGAAVIEWPMSQVLGVL